MFVTILSTDYISVEFLIQEQWGGSTQVVTLGQSLFIVGASLVQVLLKGCCLTAFRTHRHSSWFVKAAFWRPNMTDALRYPGPAVLGPASDLLGRKWIYVGKCLQALHNRLAPSWAFGIADAALQPYSCSKSLWFSTQLSTLELLILLDSRVSAVFVATPPSTVVLTSPSQCS